MSGRKRITVVGDVVLDVDLDGTSERLAPDAPVPVVDVGGQASDPGAAGLTALFCADEGLQVTLVAPLADDEPGRVLRAALEGAGVTVVALPQHGTTRVKTRVRSGGQSLVRLDSGGPATPVGRLPETARAAVAAADLVLVSCYGGGTSDDAAVRGALAAAARRVPVVWDPHPRGGGPVPGCVLVTPNRSEALAGAGPVPDAELAARLLRSWEAGAVCVTSGDRGAWLSTTATETMFVPATAVAGDTCGAGDRFVAAAARVLADGGTVSEAVTAAVAAAGAYVAAGGRAAYRRSGSVAPVTLPGSPAAPRDRVTVATGGCFDVLHAGHVATLEAARRLGDSLVVLLNGDASVRRLKGPARPVNPRRDRERVLRALECVDDVVVFDEDDPSRALDRLRPDIWVKGGDYEGSELAEGDLVRSWGGRVVVLPYVPGLSSTSILDQIH